MILESLEPRQLLAGTISEQIIVDQFGWRADAPRKVAIFADPVNGQNSAIAYTPGATFQVRRVSDDAVVFSGSTVSWKSGATDSVSGDKVWYGDFTSLTTPGEYYIYDPSNNLRSYAFKLDNNLYDDILKTAVRMYYYQRSGTAIPAQYGGNWTHAIDHVGPNQDTQARQWQGTSVVPGSPVLDVSGGWFDAGDYNKYVPWTTNLLWNLLAAYEWNPGAFGDNWNIPESGNGVPDILDEVKWELDWLLKMQTANGSVINRVGSASWDSGSWDPSTDTQPRYYTAPTTWATASFAASAAHASRVFAAFEPRYPGYSATLLTAATNAWNYLAATPSMTPSNGGDGTGSLGEGGISPARADSTSDQDLRLRVLAAAELWKTTGNTTYKAYFEANYNSPASYAGSFHPLADWPHFDPITCAELNRAFVTYATTPGANASIVSQINTAAYNMAQYIIVSAYNNLDDPYRSYMWTGHYTWGSNSIKSEWANILLFAIRLNVGSAADRIKYREVAEEYLHYFHGRNPLSFVYLSNMGTHGANLGADKSPMQIWHGWFGDGSPLYDDAASVYGPAPGYLVGGPNQYFSASTVRPPAGEPPMKAFKDWNTGWPENSWEITEPSIGYQAAYSLLLSQFATDVYPPQVLACSFNHLVAPHAVSIRFNENVAASLSKDDLSLVNLTTGTTIASSQLSLAYNGVTNTATLTYVGGILPDGNYRLTVIASGVTDPAGNPMAADYVFSDNFFVLGGDADHDRDVDNADFGVFFSHFGQSSGATFADGDFDYDGDVDNADFGIFFAHFNATLPAAAPTIASAQPAPVAATIKKMVSIRRRAHRVIDTFIDAAKPSLM